MEHWYVYYKLDAPQLAAWLPHAARLMAHVHAASGVQGRLLQRADVARQADGIVTLMEVYDGIVDAQRFGPVLEAAVADARVAAPACADVARHTERFASVHLGHVPAHSATDANNAGTTAVWTTSTNAAPLSVPLSAPPSASRAAAND